MGGHFVRSTGPKWPVLLILDGNLEHVYGALAFGYAEHDRQWLNDPLHLQVPLDTYCAQIYRLRALDRERGRNPLRFEPSIARGAWRILRAGGALTFLNQVG